MGLLAGAEIGVAIFATLCQRRQEASAFLLTFDLLELNGSNLPSYRRGLQPPPRRTSTTMIMIRSVVVSMLPPDEAANWSG